MFVMTKRNILTVLSVAAFILSAQVAEGKTTCKKTTTFETDRDGNTIIKTHTKCTTTKGEK